MLRLVIAALLSALLTGLGTYLALAKDVATRSEVRVMIAEEIASVDRQSNETAAIVIKNQEQLTQLDQKLDDVNIRLARIEAKLNVQVR